MSAKKRRNCAHVFDYGRVKTLCPSPPLPGGMYCRVHVDAASTTSVPREPQR